MEVAEVVVVVGLRQLAPVREVEAAAAEEVAEVVGVVQPRARAQAQAQARAQVDQQ